MTAGAYGKVRSNWTFAQRTRREVWSRLAIWNPTSSKHQALSYTYLPSDLTPVVSRSPGGVRTGLWFIILFRCDWMQCSRWIGRDGRDPVQQRNAALAGPSRWVRTFSLSASPSILLHIIISLRFAALQFQRPHCHPCLSSSTLAAGSACFQGAPGCASSPSQTFTNRLVSSLSYYCLHTILLGGEMKIDDLSH